MTDAANMACHVSGRRPIPITCHLSDPLVSHWSLPFKDSSFFVGWGRGSQNLCKHSCSVSVVRNRDTRLINGYIGLLSTGTVRQRLAWATRVHTVVHYLLQGTKICLFRFPWGPRTLRRAPNISANTARLRTMSSCSVGKLWLFLSIF
jgi:hypothetical protein